MLAKASVFCYSYTMQKEIISMGDKEIEVIIGEQGEKWIVVAYEWVVNNLKSTKQGDYKLSPREFDTKELAEDFYNKTLVAWR